LLLSCMQSPTLVKLLMFFIPKSLINRPAIVNYKKSSMLNLPTFSISKTLHSLEQLPWDTREITTFDEKSSEPDAA
jgi:hypothetical protein